MNRGLWGVTIGGKETLTSTAAFRIMPGCCRRMRSTSRNRRTHTIGFEQGVPVSLDGARLDPVA